MFCLKHVARIPTWVNATSSPLYAACQRAAAAGASSDEAPRVGRGRRKPLGVAPRQGSESHTSRSGTAGQEPATASRNEATASSHGATSSAEQRRTSVREQVAKHVDRIQRRSRQILEDPKSEDGDKFRLSWRPAAGHDIPYRFRLQDPLQQRPREKPTEEEKGNRSQQDDGEKAAAALAKEEERKELRQARAEHAKKPYADHAGLRFPTLETAESYNYHQDSGLDKLVERNFPIMVPGYRRLDPYLREYIHFLHQLDPARFTVARIAERYRLREKTVAKVVQEWAVNHYLTSTGLTTLKEKQATKESEIMKAKEAMYAKWVGWDQLGDQEDADTDDEELGEFKGWRPTSDWVRRQKVEVEMMSAFPMMEKRSPMPKRVDVDMTVATTRSHKIINWIDPTDKVVF